ncbi:MAG: septum formation protein Maf [Chloroflexi bacterium]|nr:septum formation protein Maf [Chloroflexota bacterium]
MGSDHNRALILASRSPRRAEILGEAGIEFKVVSTDIDEDRLLSGPGALDDAVQRLALEKARTAAELTPGAFVLGADTIVVLDGHILGKPESPSHAVDMLQRMSGRAHDVISGVAVVGPDGESHTDFVSTLVRFRRLSDEEISHYVSSGSPLDKAGSYGIQDRSFAPVESYDECYLNVVGLPMCVTNELLENTGLLPPGKIICRGHARPDYPGAKVLR